MEDLPAPIELGRAQSAFNEEESWDSVQQQPQCVACDRLFSTHNELALHASFSATHLRRMQELASDSSAAGREQEDRVLVYRGRKRFYWTGETIEVDVFQHGEALEVESQGRLIAVPLQRVLSALSSSPAVGDEADDCGEGLEGLIAAFEQRKTAVSFLLSRLAQVHGPEGEPSVELEGLEDADHGPALAKLQLQRWQSVRLDAPAPPSPVPAPSQAVYPKLCCALEAVADIRSGDTVTVSGFCGSGFAEELVLALASRFEQTAEPRDLTLLYGVAQGDTKGRGLDVLASPGLLRRCLGGHSGVARGLQRLFEADQVEAFNLPLGCLSALYRDIAAGRPGTLSPVGLGTFADPRLAGCALNQSARTSAQPVVELVSLSSEREYLLYKSFPVHVALLRGTTADAAGNVSIEDEAVVLDVLAQATAVRNCGGVVVVQVRRLSPTPLPARSVAIPGVMVDRVVLASPLRHWQTLAEPDDDACLAGQKRIPLSNLNPLPLTARKVIARRAAQEFRRGMAVNLGLGLPEACALVAAEHDCIDCLTLTAEAGVIGGVPASGLRFGTAYNTDAILPTSALFDWYSGGGLDVTCLGFAQVSATGNVNVGRFDGRFPGVGGFVEISSASKRILFLGTHCVRAKLSFDDPTAAVTVQQEGGAKFVPDVDLVTFSGSYAARKGTPVLYVTERAVFRLVLNEETGEGQLMLVEVAPGLDVEKDVLAAMDFRPLVAPEVAHMDASLFGSFSLPHLASPQAAACQ